MKRSKPSPPRQPFTTLALTKALATGWGVNLNVREVRVMLWVAQFGHRRTEGVAFTWLCLQGTEGWSEETNMPHSSLREALRGLERKGYMLRWKERDTYAHALHPAAGIPNEVFNSIVLWNTDQEVARAIRMQRVTSTLDMQDPIKHRMESHQTPDGIPSNVDAVTCEDVPYNPCSNPGRTHPPKGTPATPGVKGAAMSDGWDQPSDGPDDWAESTPAKGKRPPARTTVLCDLFYAQWVVARETRPNLNVPWNNKPAFMANLKRLLQDYDDEQIAHMIEHFFSMVSHSGIPLKGDELWKDFWNNRSRLSSSPREEAPQAPDDDEFVTVDGL